MTAKTTAKEVADADTLISENKHKRAVLSRLGVDNQSTSAVQLTLRDTFDVAACYTAAGVAVAAATDQTVDRLVFSVAAGDSISLGEDDLKDIKCLGDVKIFGDSTQTACIITLAYHLN